MLDTSQNCICKLLVQQVGVWKTEHIQVPTHPPTQTRSTLHMDLSGARDFPHAFYYAEADGGDKFHMK